MCDAITSSVVKWFQRLIDCFRYICRNTETPVLSEDKTPLVDKILNSSAESISVISKDCCAIAENNANCKTLSTESSSQSLTVNKENGQVILNDKNSSADSKDRNESLSTESSAQCSAVNKENGKVILNDKNSGANSKDKNESLTENGLTSDRDLPTTFAQNGVSQISSSKSSFQPVMLNGKPGASVFNSKTLDSFKDNDFKTKNGPNGEKDLPLASTKNGVSKLCSSSKSSSHPVMLNKESSCVNENKISNEVANGEESESRTEKRIVNGKCSQTASKQNHVKICRYSLKPLHCKTGSLKNTNGKRGQTSNCKDQVVSVTKVYTPSRTDVIQNVFSNEGKRNKIRTPTKTNDEPLTKNPVNDKNLTAFPQNGVEKVCQYSSGSLNNEVAGIPDQKEQIEQILRSFEKFRAMKDDVKIENQISLDNNKLRIRRLGMRYNRSVSLQSPEAEHFPTNSLSSEQNVDKVKDKEILNSQTSSTCGRHSIKRLSLPNIHSGCTYVTAKESENVKLPGPSLETLKVPNTSYRVMSFPDLRCGGIVVFDELSKHISLPNLFDKDPVVYNVPCPTLNFPSILPSDNLRLERERVTGGGLIKEDDSKKISLPDLISRDRSLQENRASSGYGSTSGGGLVNTSDTDHIFYSDILSNTVACEQISSVREFMNSENSATGNIPRTISESDLSDFVNRDPRNFDESRRNSSIN